MAAPRQRLVAGEPRRGGARLLRERVADRRPCSSQKAPVSIVDRILMVRHTSPVQTHLKLG